MKKTYEAPEAEIQLLENQDVLAISISEGKGKLEEITWNDLK